MGAQHDTPIRQPATWKINQLLLCYWYDWSLHLKDIFQNSMPLSAHQGWFEGCSPFASSRYCRFKNNMPVQNRIIQKGDNEKCIAIYYSIRWATCKPTTCGTEKSFRRADQSILWNIQYTPANSHSSSHIERLYHSQIQMWQRNHQEPIQFSNWTQETNAFVPELNTSNLTPKAFPLTHTHKTPRYIPYLSPVPSSLLKHIGIISKPSGGREIVKSGLLSCVRWKCDILHKQ